MKDKHIGILAAFSLYTLYSILYTPTVAAFDIGSQYGFGNIPTVGQALNNLVQPAFAIAGILVVMFFIVGAARYIASGGEKEAVASARNMMVHAIIGFILLIFVFLFIRWFPGALGLQNYQFFN